MFRQSPARQFILTLAKRRLRLEGACDRQTANTSDEWRNNFRGGGSKMRDRLDSSGRKLVFSNGCFDILHRGHVKYLEFARAQGDALIVGLNNDSSVTRNKGPDGR